MSEIKGIPGAEIIEQGLSDLSLGVDSEEACLVMMAHSRLTQLGLQIPISSSLALGTREAPPEACLYEILAKKHGNGAHSKFKAYERRLHSFLRSASLSK